MERFLRALVPVGLAGVAAAAAHGGCAATETDDKQSAQQGTGAHGGAPGAGGSGAESSSDGGGGTINVGSGGSGGAGGEMGCASFTAEAHLKPAAMLTVLDMSESMSSGNKWQTAQQAVVNAGDRDVFDSMALGLYTFPTSFANPPQCFCDALGDCDLFLLLYPGVTCGVSGIPQIPMALAGTNKSYDATGVRRQIYDYLASHGPLTGASAGDDGSPIYDAMSYGYDTLEAVSGVDERMLLLITDGGFSCTSLSNPPRPGYDDDIGCADWEYPDTVNQLISARYADPTTPVRTFVVGVPGSNSTGDPDAGGFDTPDYSMLLALSTYAVSGLPTTVDPACDSGLVFDPMDPAPANPCHFDLSSGVFNPNVLADAIAQIRGTALGCVYPLPDPPPNETIDPTKVNVEVTLEQNPAETIPKRSNPSDDCAAAGCWDYNASMEVEILGLTCDQISAANDARVDIVVGCETIIN